MHGLINTILGYVSATLLIIGSLREVDHVLVRWSAQDLSWWFIAGLGAGNAVGLIWALGDGAGPVIATECVVVPSFVLFGVVKRFPLSTSQGRERGASEALKRTVRAYGMWRGSVRKMVTLNSRGFD